MVRIVEDRQGVDSVVRIVEDRQGVDSVVSDIVTIFARHKVVCNCHFTILVVATSSRH